MVIIPAIIAYILLSIGLYKLAKRFTHKRWVHNTVIAVMVLIPTYDTIITYTLAGYYCATDPHPKTYIKHTVENPISIYWEDNVYPGYSEIYEDEYGSPVPYSDVTLMIVKYLDGVHVKTMAFNMPDGKVKVFSATLDDWANSKNISKHDSISLWRDARKIASQGIVFEKNSMPTMNYTVTLKAIKLPFIVGKFLYGEDGKIVRNSNSEIILNETRFYKIRSDFIADYLGPLNPDPICGNSRGPKQNPFESKSNFYFSEHIIGLNKRFTKNTNQEITK